MQCLSILECSEANEKNCKISGNLGDQWSTMQREVLKLIRGPDSVARSKDEKFSAPDGPPRQAKREAALNAKISTLAEDINQTDAD